MQGKVGVLATERSDAPFLEFNEYLSNGILSEDDDPLNFWSSNRHHLPVLSKLACRYLLTPASSGPMEKHFAISGKIFRPDRCCLSDKIF
jgi:hypothetical protein